jgi:hypothetical protein
MITRKQQGELDLLIIRLKDLHDESENAPRNDSEGAKERIAERKKIRAKIKEIGITTLVFRYISLGICSERN